VADAGPESCACTGACTCTCAGSSAAAGAGAGAAARARGCGTGAPTALAPRPVQRVKPAALVASIAPIAPVRKPAQAAAHVDSQPAACAPQPDEAQACSALGAKNAALRGQLDKLEEKVKGLQQHMGVAPAGAPAKAEGVKAAKHKAEEPKAAEPKAEEPKAEEPKTEAHKAGEQKPEAHKPEQHKPEEALAPPKPLIKPAGPKPISSIKPLVIHKPKATAEEGGATWGWIAAGIAALAAFGAQGACAQAGACRQYAGHVRQAQAAFHCAHPGSGGRRHARKSRRTKPGLGAHELVYTNFMHGLYWFACDLLDHENGSGPAQPPPIAWRGNRRNADEAPDPGSSLRADSAHVDAGCNRQEATPGDAW
jgi:hypothetical protein